MHKDKDFIESDQKLQISEIYSDMFHFFQIFRHLKTLYVSWRLESAINSNVFQIYTKNYETYETSLELGLFQAFSSHDFVMYDTCSNLSGS